MTSPIITEHKSKISASAERSFASKPILVMLCPVVSAQCIRIISLRRQMRPHSRRLPSRLFFLLFSIPCLLPRPAQSCPNAAGAQRNANLTTRVTNVPQNAPKTPRKEFLCNKSRKTQINAIMCKASSTQQAAPAIMMAIATTYTASSTQQAIYQRKSATQSSTNESDPHSTFAINSHYTAIAERCATQKSRMIPKSSSTSRPFRSCLTWRCSSQRTTHSSTTPISNVSVFISIQKQSR